MRCVQTDFTGIGSVYVCSISFPTEPPPDSSVLFTVSRLYFTPSSLADSWSGYAQPPSHPDASRKPSSSRERPASIPLSSRVGPWQWVKPRTQKSPRDLQDLDQPRSKVGVLLVSCVVVFPRFLHVTRVVNCINNMGIKSLFFLPSASFHCIRDGRSSLFLTYYHDAMTIGSFACCTYLPPSPPQRAQPLKIAQDGSRTIRQRAENRGSASAATKWNRNTYSQ